MSAYYNERDGFAAQWLRNLIAAGHLPPGEVDERDIRDVTPEELKPFTQCHFFAGIGVWPYALRRAGWDDDRPVWTGSCPCQPFSAAGKRGGVDDERHLWPHWHWLISQRGPPVVLGEQVASKDGLGWLDLVSADLEGTGYAVGASDLCAAGFGGAHIRQRLYFVGLADSESGGCRVGRDAPLSREGGHVDSGSDLSGRLGNPEREKLPEQRRLGRVSQPPSGSPEGQGAGGTGASTGGLADAHGFDTRAERKQLRRLDGFEQEDGVFGGREHSGSGRAGESGLSGTGSPLLGREPVDWLYCRDGKWRPVEPGSFPLANAAPARVGRLRAYGNALDAKTAEEFIGSVIETIDALPTWRTPVRAGQINLL